MDASRDAKPTAGTKPEIAGRLRSIAKIVIIDVAAPLIAYSLLRSAGMSTVMALVLSGVFPALGVAIGVIQHRRLDVVGALVLAGILVGTVLGLISHSARLVLMEGSVPTAIFGVGCLGARTGSLANPAGEIGQLREGELPVVRVIVPPDLSGPVFEDDLDPGDLVFDGKPTPMLIWHERSPVGRGWRSGWVLSYDTDGNGNPEDYWRAGVLAMSRGLWRNRQRVVPASALRFHSG